MDVLIEHAQRDVGQEWGKDPSLRGPGRGVPLLTELGEDSGLEERLDQGQHALVLHPRPHPAHQGGVVDGVETRFDVGVQHPPVLLGAEQVDLSDRVVRPPPGPEPVGDRHEVGLENRFQHQLQRRLHHPVGDGRDAEPAHLPATAGFGDHAFTHRHRAELARLHRVPQIVQEPLDVSILHVDGPQAVYAGGPGPGATHDPAPRHIQRGRVPHEVEQIVEPAAWIGRRPTVQLGLHLRYPPERGDPPGRCAGIHRPIFRHSSLLAARSRCRPSPCVRLSRPPTTTTVPPQPRPDRSTVDPAPTSRAGGAVAGQQPRRFPCSLLSRSTEEEPDFVPAASPRLPRSTSPWPPAEPPMDRLGVPRR